MEDNKLSELLSDKLEYPRDFILSPIKEDSNNSTLNIQDDSLDPYTPQLDNDVPVVSEIPISSGQLHKIAAGNYCLLGQKGEPFAVRFMLKSSFKLKKNDFVVRNIVMQIVAVGKDNVMRREDMATDVKLVKSQSKISTKQIKEEMQFKINDNKKELF